MYTYCESVICLSGAPVVHIVWFFTVPIWHMTLICMCLLCDLWVRDWEGRNEDDAICSVIAFLQ